MKVLFLVALLAVSVYAQFEFDSICGQTSSLQLGTGIVSLGGDGDVWVLSDGFGTTPAAVFQREFQGAFEFQDHVVIGSSAGTCLSKTQYDSTNGFTVIIRGVTKTLQSGSVARGIRRISTVSAVEEMHSMVVSRDAEEMAMNLSVRGEIIDLVRFNGVLAVLSISHSDVIVTINEEEFVVANNGESAEYQLIADHLLQVIGVEGNTIHEITFNLSLEEFKAVEYTMDAQLNQWEAVSFNSKLYIISVSGNTISHYECAHDSATLQRSIQLENEVSDWSVAFKNDALVYFVSTSHQGISSVFCEDIACEEAQINQLVSFTRESSGVKSHFIDDSVIFAFATGNNEIAIGSCLDEQCSSVSFTKSSSILANHDSLFDFVSTESGMMLVTATGYTQEFHLNIHENCNVDNAGTLSIIDEEVYVCSVLDATTSSEVFLWVPVAPPTI